MGRRDGVRSGTSRGCLLNGCLTMLVLLHACVIGLWVWVATEDDRAEGKAHADLRSGAEAGQERLIGAAADGAVHDSEVARVFPRGLTRETYVTGRYAFKVALDGHRMPLVTVRELAVQNEPQSACTAAGVPSPSVLPSR